MSDETQKEKDKAAANEALDRAIAVVGSMQALADLLDVTKGAVGQWKLPDRKIPADHCPTIERLTSAAIRCEELRPDVDWAVLRTLTAPQPDQQPN